MIGILVVLGLVAAGFVIELVAAIAAPLGYEDQSGFHFGSQPIPAWEDAGGGSRVEPTRA